MKCYACDEPVIGHALRDADGGPARGDDSPQTIAVPGCYRHAWDPYDHPALQRLAPLAPAYIAPCTVTWAIDFAGEHHRHCDDPPGGLWAVRLNRVRRTIAVALVGRPSARHLQDGFTAQVSRVCAAGIRIMPQVGEAKDASPYLAGDRNACSRLYGACRRAAAALGYRRVITYTLVSEDGASLRASGWRQVAETKPGAWSREDRPRKRKAIEDEPKIRWEHWIANDIRRQPLDVLADPVNPPPVDASEAAA